MGTLYFLLLFSVNLKPLYSLPIKKIKNRARLYPQPPGIWVFGSQRWASASLTAPRWGWCPARGAGSALTFLWQVPRPQPCSALLPCTPQRPVGKRQLLGKGTPGAPQVPGPRREEGEEQSGQQLRQFVSCASGSLEPLLSLSSVF